MLKHSGQVAFLCHYNQGLGNDGYFIVREVSPFWLKLSLSIRKLKLDNILGFLPGVKRHPEVSNAFIINKRIAFILTLQIFHLFGYRRKTKENGKMVVSRLKYDFKPPTNTEILENFNHVVRFE